MATFTVTNTNDSGAGSLREAIEDANGLAGNDDIVFDPSLSGATIRLTSGTLAITDELVINGDIDDDGLPDIIVTGDVLNDDLLTTDESGNPITDALANTAYTDNVRVFSISAQPTEPVTLSGLVITGGVAGNTGPDAYGGGIYIGTPNVELTITNASVSGNVALQNGGGLYNYQSQVTIENTLFSQNFATGDGGAISTYGAMAITNAANATFSGNQAYNGDGGAIEVKTEARLNLVNATVSGNIAGDDGGGVHAVDSLGRVTPYGSNVGYTAVVFSTFTGNVAGTTSPDGQGGGVAFEDSDVFFFFNIVSGNAADTDPQAYRSGGSEAGIAQNQFGLQGGFALSDLFFETAPNPFTGVTSGVLRDNGGLVPTVLPNPNASKDGGKAFENDLIVDQVDPGENPVVFGATDITDIDRDGTFDEPIVVDARGAPRQSDFFAEDRSDYGAVEIEGIYVTTLDDTGKNFKTTFGGGTGGAKGYFKDLDDGNPGIKGAPSTKGLSLREAIFHLESGKTDLKTNTVLFDPALAGGTIFVGSGKAFEIREPVVINAADREITIDADGESRIFEIIGGSGGIMFGESPTPAVSGVTSTPFEEGTTILRGLTLTDGFAGGIEARGGAIYAYGQSVYLIESTVRDSMAVGKDAFGGGIYVGEGGGPEAYRLGLVSSTLTGNTAYGYKIAGGGGAYASSLYALNATIQGNYALAFGSGKGFAVGGGIAAENAAVYYATIVGNEAYGGSGYGGGIDAEELVLGNSIVTANLSPAGEENADNVSTPPADVDPVGQNIVGSALRGTDSLALIEGGIAPEDVFQTVGTGFYGQPLPGIGDNGGPVPTVALLGYAGNPALEAASIGTSDRWDLDGDGDRDEPLSRDARGQPRDTDVDGVGGTPDLGAFELLSLAFEGEVVVTTADDELDSEAPDASVADFGGPDDISLREAAVLANQTPFETTTIRFAEGAGEAFEFAETIRLDARDGDGDFRGEIVFTADVEILGPEAGLTITGDAAGDDILTEGGFTDIKASFFGLPPKGDGPKGFAPEKDFEIGESRLTDNARIFNFRDGVEGSEITGLTFTGGYAGAGVGGAVRSALDLTVIDSLFHGNASTGFAVELKDFAPLPPSPKVSGELEGVLSDFPELEDVPGTAFIGSGLDSVDIGLGGGAIGVNGGFKGGLPFPGPFPPSLEDGIPFDPVIALDQPLALEGGDGPVSLSVPDFGGEGGAVSFEVDGAELPVANAAFGLEEASLTLLRTEVVDNITTGIGGAGGGVFATGDVRLTESYVAGNATLGLALAGGGGVASFGDVFVENSVVAYNTTVGAISGGGGILGFSLEEGGSRVVVSEDSKVYGNLTGDYSLIPFPDIGKGDPITFEDPQTFFGGSGFGDYAGLYSPGGGIFSTGFVVLRDSALGFNATEGYAAGGGAIASPSRVILEDSLLLANTTGRDDSPGGAVDAGAATVVRSQLLHNATYGGFSGGGAINTNDDGGRSLVLVNSSLIANRTQGEESHGGGANASGTITGVNLTASGNIASGYGAEGGALRTAETGRLSNATITGNAVLGTGGEGGGFFGMALRSSNSIIAFNHDSDPGQPTDNDLELSGGGGTAMPDLTGVNLLYGTIYGGPDDGTMATAPEVFALTGQLVDPGYGPIPVVSGVPAANGGPVGTVMLRADEDNPLLDVGEPIPVDEETGGAGLLALRIDADGDGEVDNPVDTDARLLARDVDVVPPPATPDVGAVELQNLFPEGLSFVVTTREDELDSMAPDADVDDMGGKGDLSLREAVFLANNAPGPNTITFDPGEFSGGADSVITLDGTDGDGGLLGTIFVTDAVTIDATDGTDVVVTGDVMMNDVTVGTTPITDVEASLMTEVELEGDVKKGGPGLADPKTGKTGTALSDNIRLFASFDALEMEGLTLTGGRVGEDFKIPRDPIGKMPKPIALSSDPEAPAALALGGGGYGAGYGAFKLDGPAGAPYVPVDAGGGAIASYGAALTLLDMTLAGNSTGGSSQEGGAVSAINGDVTVERTSFTGNASDGDGAKGGALYVGAVAPDMKGGGPIMLAPLPPGPPPTIYLEVSESRFTGNATTGDEAGGGAVAGVGIERARFTDTVLDENFTGGSGSAGGGLFNRNEDGGLLILRNATVARNETMGESAPGGGVFNDARTVIRDSLVDENATAGTDSDGGGIFADSARLTISGSRIRGNETSGDDAEGGGIYSGRAVTLFSSTIDNNATLGMGSEGGGLSAGAVTFLANATVVLNGTAGAGGEGGGIFNDGPLSILNATVTGNATAGSGGAGGGVHGTGDITVRNSLVTGNVAAMGATDAEDDIVGGSVTYQGGNVVGGTAFADAAPTLMGLTAADLFALTGPARADVNGDGVLDGADGTQADAMGETIFFGRQQPNDGPQVGASAETRPLTTVELLPDLFNPALDAGTGPLPTEEDVRTDDDASGATEAVPITNDQRGPGFLRDVDLALVGATPDLGAFEVQAVDPPSTVVTTAEDNTDLTDGLTSLREAIAAASLPGAPYGDTVTFDPSVFPSMAGTTIALDPAKGPVEIGAAITIDGDHDDDMMADVVLSGGDAMRVLTIDDGVDSAVGTTVAIDGVIVRDGLSDEDNVQGGGILVARGETLLLSNSEVRENAVTGAQATGGGIALVRDARLEATNVLIADNVAEFLGGGIGAEINTGIKLVGSTVGGNAATERDGGGIFARAGAEITVVDSAIKENDAGRDGGGIATVGNAARDTTLILTGSLVGANTAEGDGGGVFFGGYGAVTIADTTVTGNATVTNGVAYAHGGGAFLGEGTSAFIVQSSFAGNQALSTGVAGSMYARGGGLFHDGDEAFLVNTLFTGNASVGAQEGYGGGIFAAGGSDLELANAILLGNYESSQSGGGDVYAVGAPDLVGGNIVGEEFSVDGAVEGGPVAAGGVFATTASLMVDTTGDGAADTDTGVEAGVLAENGAGEVGAKGDTMVPQTAALLPDLLNPAIDVSDPTAALTLDEAAVMADLDGDGMMDDTLFSVSELAFDQRGENPAPGADDGFNRDEDVPGVGGTPDLGPYEIQEADLDPPSLVVTTTEDSTDLTDGETSLREALAFAKDPAVLADLGVVGTPVITFADGAGAAFDGGGTIHLDPEKGELMVMSDVTIDGDLDDDMMPDVTVSADSAMGADDAQSRVFLIDDGAEESDGIEAKIDGLVIRDGSPTEGDGGGILIGFGDSLTLMNAEVVDNEALADDAQGGGIAVGREGTFEAMNVLISGNEADRDGGGIGADQRDATVKLVGSTLASNTAGRDGGGLTTGGRGLVTVVDSAVKDNEAGRDGGGIDIGGNVTFPSQLFVTDSLISGNRAGREGGGIQGGQYSTVDIVNTTIASNAVVAEGDSVLGGGAVFGESSTVQIIQSTVVGNEALAFNAGTGDGATGGGLWFGAIASGLVLNTTVTGNAALGYYGGLGGGIFSSAGGALTLGNSIVAGNDASTGPDLENTSGSPAYAGGNIVGTVFSVDGTAEGGPVDLADVFATTANLTIDTTGDGAADTDTGVVAGVAEDLTDKEPGSKGQTMPLPTVGLIEDLGNPALDASDTSIPFALDEMALMADVTGDDDMDDMPASLADIAEDQEGDPRDVEQPGLGTPDLGPVEAAEVETPPIANDATGQFVASDFGETAFEDGPAITIDLDENLGDGQTIESLAFGRDIGTLGMVTIDPGGRSVTYDPAGGWEFLAAGETAPDEFVFRSFVNGVLDEARVQVQIEGQNDDPTARDNVAAVDADGLPRDILVTLNDSDPDLTDDIEVVSVDTTGTRGAVRIQVGAEGVIYDPAGMFGDLAEGETAVDTFEYTIADGNGGFDSATVRVTVTGTPTSTDVNTPPSAVDDDFAVSEDEGPFFFNLLGNDVDPNLDPLSILSLAPVSAQGLFELVGGTTLRYDPEGRFALGDGETATDVFTYTVTDGREGTQPDTGTVTITVNGVGPQPPAEGGGDDDGGDGGDDGGDGGGDDGGVSGPIARDDDVTAIVGQIAGPVSLFADNGFGPDRDPDGDDLAVVAVNGSAASVGGTVTLPSGAEVTVGADGLFTYDPGDAFDLFGNEETTDSFTYTIDDMDDDGLTDTATVTVRVTGQQFVVVNDPDGTADNAITDFDEPVKIDSNGEGNVRISGDVSEFDFEVIEGGFRIIPVDESGEQIGEPVDICGVRSIDFDDATVLRDESQETEDVTFVFQTFLGRLGGPEGIGFWSNRVLETSLEAVAEQFPLSFEFQDRFVPGMDDDPETIEVLSNDDFVDLMFMNGYGRLPAQGGQDFWSDILDEGLLSQYEFGLVVAQSQEIRERFADFTENGILRVVGEEDPLAL